MQLFDRVLGERNRLGRALEEKQGSGCTPWQPVWSLLWGCLWEGNSSSSSISNSQSLRCQNMDPFLGQWGKWSLYWPQLCILFKWLKTAILRRDDTFKLDPDEYSNQTSLWGQIQVQVEIGSGRQNTIFKTNENRTWHQRNTNKGFPQRWLEGQG